MEQVITSVVEKNNSLHEQKFSVYWKIRIEDRGSRIGHGESGIEDRLKKKKLENKINK